MITLLAPFLTLYSGWWWVTLLTGIAIILGAGGHLLLEHFRPKKLPELHCFFNMKDIGGCVCPNTVITRPKFINTLQSQSTSPFDPAWRGYTITPSTPDYIVTALPSEKGTYYRIKVSVEHETVFSCKGKLESLKRGSQKIIPEPIDLPFAPAENPDHANKTIHFRHPEHLDFLFIADDNHVEVTPPNFYGPSNVAWSTLFSTPDDYVFDISVLSPTAQTNIAILFHWTGKRDTARLVAMN